MRSRPEAARRAYGVRWLFVYDSPGFQWPRREQEILGQFAGPVRLLAQDQARLLYDLGTADPMAFFADAPGAALTVRDHDGAIVIDLPARRPDRRVVLNFLARPGLVLLGDGEELASTADEWGRLSAKVPASVSQLRVDFFGGWGRGFFFGIVGLLVAMAIAVVALARAPEVLAEADPEFGQDEFGQDEFGQDELDREEP